MYDSSNPNHTTPSWAHPTFRRPWEPPGQQVACFARIFLGRKAFFGSRSQESNPPWATVLRVGLAPMLYISTERGFVHRRSFIIYHQEWPGGLACERPAYRLALRKDLLHKELNVPRRSSASSISPLTLFRRRLSMSRKHGTSGRVYNSIPGGSFKQSSKRLRQQVQAGSSIGMRVRAMSLTARPSHQMGGISLTVGLANRTRCSE